ncbi:MAG TPA: MFS transporter, partial [Microlunatus sp.]|nr:MFS transporter [Microlunatus sp.]
MTEPPVDGVPTARPGPSSRKTVVTDGMVSPGRVAGMVIMFALVLAAFNLRPVVTSVGPVLAEIRSSLGMSGLVAGLLTALPGACFVAFGALAPRMVARTFPSRLLWMALTAAAVGLAVRPFLPTTATFVLFSCVALGGIGVANIMMPVVVRRAFPDRVGTVTGLYSMGLALGASIAAAVTVPLTNALGGDWRLGLAAWAIPAALAAALWMGVARWIRQRAGGAPAPVSTEGLRITRSRTAWAVAILFGLQSTQAYVTIGWVPQIYRDAGLSPTYAGVLLALIPAIGVPTSFLVPTIAARRRSQGGVAVMLTGLGVIGYLGLLLIPTTVPWLWVIVLGISQAVFPLALALIGLRTRSSAGTIGLSSFGQS